MILNDLIFISLLSVGFTIIFQLVFKKLYRKNNLIVKINQRSSHSIDATATGGIAIFLSLFLVTLFFYFKSNLPLYNYRILLPLALLFITGVIDDLQGTDFKIKLVFQIIAAKLLIDQGFVLDEFYGLKGLFEPNYFLAQLLTGFLFLSIINSVNFIDGLDGLALFYSLFILCCSIIFTSNNNLNPFNTIIIFSLLVSVYFNFLKSKKVFLGDSGSLLLGGVIALNALNILEPGVKINFGLDPNKFLFVGLLLFYPIADITRTVLYRVKNRISPFFADKNHLHHLINQKINQHFYCSLLIVLGCALFYGIGLIIWLVFDEIGLLFLLAFSFIVVQFIGPKEKIN